ncbi:hypothetical protein LCGC14_1683520 [marine sediment metagenome]|uniref:Uncharacterized protein n=1 Tax=marine sediment metagenome TaxID=412755 RepID=A0A0F9HN18_9ZZZZ
MYLRKVTHKRVVVQGGVSQKAAYAWVNYLNEILTADREFLSELVQTRVKCGAEIAMHPTLQVINLNQLDDVLAPPPPPEPKPMLPSGDKSLGRDWESPYPEMPPANPARDLEKLPQPRWVAGVLGLINGFIGISEHGKGPIDATVDTDTGLILEFTVSEPYKKRKG